MTIKKIQPASLFQRALDGRVLYSHVVVASGESLVFISGTSSSNTSMPVTTISASVFLRVRPLKCVAFPTQICWLKSRQSLS